MAKNDGIIRPPMEKLFSASTEREDNMPLRKVGRHGVNISAFSLGFWNNFGETGNYANCRKMVTTAFDLGISSFDLANGYGPPYGAAETTFGRIFKQDLASYRSQMFVATKAGFPVHPSQYGCGGSRKALIDGINDSLSRLGLDYVDLFYYHKHDMNTPLEETADALAQIVRSGKATYVGVSNMDAQYVQELADLLWDGYKVRLFMDQVGYNMLDRAAETNGRFDVAAKNGLGVVPYVALAQGLLTGKYNNGIPAGSRAATPGSFLPPDRIQAAQIEKVKKLVPIAEERGQSMSQLALAWILRLDVISSVLIGASRPEQIVDNVKALDNLEFSAEELERIDAILNG